MPVDTNLTNLALKPESYFTQTRPEMMPFVPPAARRILDVGCAEGWFGKQLKEQREAEVWGIEVVEAAATSARRFLDHVCCGDVFEELKKFPAASFDCIVFNDVLEHLVDPFAVLVAAKRLLAPKGVVVCSIPNIRFFRPFFNFVVRADWHYEDAGIMDKTHLRFFTKKSIARMFPALGYRIQRLEGINPTSSWRVALLNAVLFGAIEDTRYLQFACVAEPITAA